MLRIATGIILLVGGATWTLQGVDSAIAPESFMTGDRLWTWIGALTVLVGIGLIWWGARAK